jgi:ammonia channel protein AmtB
VFAYCADAIFNGSMSEGAALKRLLVVCVLMLTIIFLPQAVKRLTRRAPAQPPGLQ